MQVSLEKACRLGYIDPDMNMAVLHPPPLVFKEQLHNCNGEVMRLRVQLKRAEGQINEIKEREASSKNESFNIEPFLFQKTLRFVISKSTTSI